MSGEKLFTIRQRCRILNGAPRKPQMCNWVRCTRPEMKAAIDQDHAEWGPESVLAAGSWALSDRRQDFTDGTAGVDIGVCLCPRRHCMSGFAQTLSAPAGHICSCLKLRLRKLRSGLHPACMPSEEDSCGT